MTAAAVTMALATATLAVAGPPDLGGDDAGHADGAVRGISDTGVYPGLRAVSDIGAPGGEPRDSGAGVYPALTAPGSLQVPSLAALAGARRWLATRRGVVAFAVASEHGGVVGVAPRRRFLSASLTKAMVLAAFLRRLQRERREPTPFELLSLGYMIRISDNASTDAIYRRVGDEGMREVARRTGMEGFRVERGDWANAVVTPADQALFFMSLDRVVPARFLPLARELLEGVSPLHTWGIPAASRPAWRTFFKGGWRPEAGAEVVHQGALLESGGTAVGLSVMTADNPSMAYGERTIEGLARRLLSGNEALARSTVPSGAGADPGELAPLGDLRGFRPADPPALERLGGG